eukprot:CAMPEP_0116138922 /NCGR_PEP_ID=MMETSP0329-20121206/13031_1 /TAXON_ID=697910 /ORGANISM="Pseudo-nitzschia arenysensis, Strain B593" /LENGTH=707 /DNA_ID=CAMNT_0003633919 /DNA_START=164 /DNA_END=2287 /DNA_ORIENTATION=+
MFNLSQNYDELLDETVDTHKSIRSEKKNEIRRENKNNNGIPVFFPVYNDAESSAVTEKFMQDIRNSPSVGEIVPLDVKNPLLVEFLDSCGIVGMDAAAVKKRFAELKTSRQPHLATELLKYCALKHYQGGLFLDSQSTLSVTVDHIVSDITKAKGRNIAVLNDPKVSPDSIHGAIFYVKKQSGKVVEGMISTLLSTEVKTLEKSPLLLPKTLYEMVNKENNWYLLQHTCNLFALGQRQVTTPVSTYDLNSYRLTQNCPEPNGLCCNIHDPVNHTPTMTTKHLLLPYQVLPPPSDLPKPLNYSSGNFDDSILPYISTVKERVHPKPDQPLNTPNFYETLVQNECLPNDKTCGTCLRNQDGANCEICADKCPCYCKALCHTPVEEKFVSKSLIITPPMYARDPSRLIPRIVHQTYFEGITTEKYPNMSRLTESFKQSGWEYKFYTDEMSLEFLSTHFPPEVREAYEIVQPGAFKADLFRYCVLLIYGGVYSDVDIMLEANLDLTIGPDIGFMSPHDEPGHKIDKVMCLWNGFIAAAPGHPFLAKVIETVVNNIRNRFTSVDIDNMFCPNVDTGVPHAFDTLFTAGPCILGASINKSLGRHGQTSFHPGEFGIDEKSSKKIPGRSIILKQKKEDMGSHRFTFVEKNLVVAATDMPGADDRDEQEDAPKHYSKVHVKTGVYGLEGVYKDFNSANEELRLYVDGQWAQYINQ